MTLVFIVGVTPISEEGKMFSSQMSHHVLLELHRVREFELLAAAKESCMQESKKNPKILRMGNQNKPSFRLRFLAGVSQYLGAFACRP